MINIGIVGHNSYYGCQKCMTGGVYFREKHKMSFPRIAVTNGERQAEFRTNESFRSRLEPQHHHMRSILEDLPIDMVSAFPTSDALHLFDLGIAKR